VRQALFILDLDRCTGCAACVVACNNENPVAENQSWRKVHTFNQQRLPAAPVFHLSLACNHCLAPACLAGCPANAYIKDPRTGAVLIDEGKCMGCRYCSWVCPYEAPKFNPATGIMEKCTFCDHRQAEGMAPACVVACPTDALRFEPDGEPSTVEHAGFPETGLGPAVRIVGDRRRSAPEMTAAPVQTAVLRKPETTGWGGLRSEWSLWLFTSVATFLVAWFTAATALGRVVVLPIFAAAGILGMIVSALHLGKITRVWRGIFNFRRSWVSREAAFFSAFFGAACILTLAGGELPSVAAWAAAVLGFAALFSMDMVYRVPGQPAATVPHSAMATLTAAYYIGLLMDAPLLFWPTAALKLALYLARRDHPKPGGRMAAAVRIGIGLVLPVAILVTGTAPPGVALISAILGELVDRAEFYATLRFLTPSHQLDRDLADVSA
jgi:Fe-S-cluster-containing dehydrogenase component/DMSO reductase anchor subunit